jgi:hypothetical protein
MPAGGPAIERGDGAADPALTLPTRIARHQYGDMTRNPTASIAKRACHEARAAALRASVRVSGGR